jgi:hypothetical protein
MKWERFGGDWIRDRFVSKKDNIFIIEAVDGGSIYYPANTEKGLELYWFDDGPEVPTDSLFFGGSLAAGLEKRLEELKAAGDQAVCEYLAGFFPGLQEYWLNKHGGI